MTPAALSRLVAWIAGAGYPDQQNQYLRLDIRSQIFSEIAIGRPWRPPKNILGQAYLAPRPATASEF